MKIIGDHDEKTIAQMERCSKQEVVWSVLCADGHLGYSVPIGGVLAYRKKINISGVGFDIACGNKAVKLNIKGKDICEKEWAKIADEMYSKISFGIGRSSHVLVDHHVFDHESWRIPFIKTLKQMARSQLGTCGSGNHYVDIFVDENDDVWIGVHFGSRGLGHKIASHYLKIAGGQDGMDVPPCLVDEESEIGQEYLCGMSLAGEYAYAGRDYVINQVVNILGAKSLDSVHNHHNYCWREKHHGEDFWVVRKGSTPAFPGERGFVGGSMGDISVIIEGVDTEAARENLYSTVHGSGRVLSRRKAAGKIKRVRCEETGEKIFKRVEPGLVNEDQMRTSIKNYGVHLRGAGPDESPICYRKLNDVLKHHIDSVKILHTLTPKVVVMAGSEVIDPYKD